MQLQTLKANIRETGRKGLTTQTRENGAIPAVVYGGGAAPLSAAVDRKILEKILHAEGGAHAVVQLDFDQAANSSPVLVKALQRHPVSGKLLHVDFFRIRLDERIQTQVAVVLTGRAKGLLDGGVVDQQLREVQIECLAVDIPEHIEVDISDLGLGEGLHVSDLPVPEGVAILSDPNAAVAAIHAPRVVKTAEEEAAGAAEAAGATEAKEA